MKSLSRSASATAVSCVSLAGAFFFADRSEAVERPQDQSSENVTPPVQGPDQDDGKAVAPPRVVSPELAEEWQSLFAELMPIRLSVSETDLPLVNEEWVGRGALHATQSFWNTVASLIEQDLRRSTNPARQNALVKVQVPIDSVLDLIDREVSSDAKLDQFLSIPFPLKGPPGSIPSYRVLQEDAQVLRYMKCDLVKGGSAKDFVEALRAPPAESQLQLYRQVGLLTAARETIDRLLERDTNGVVPERKGQRPFLTDLERKFLRDAHNLLESMILQLTLPEGDSS